MAPAFEPAFEKLRIYAEAMTEADVRPKSGVGRSETALSASAALRKNNEFQKRYAEFASYLDVKARRAAEELRSASNELLSNSFRVKLFTDCLKANAVPPSLRSRSHYFLRYCDDQLFEEWESALHETSLSLLHELTEHLDSAERTHIETKMAEALRELARSDGELGESRARQIAAWLEKERGFIAKYYDESAIKSQLNKIVEEYGSTTETHRRARGPPPPPPPSQLQQGRGRSSSRKVVSLDLFDGVRPRGLSRSQQRAQQRQREEQLARNMQQFSAWRQQPRPNPSDSRRGRKFGNAGRSVSRGNRR